MQLATWPAGCLYAASNPDTDFSFDRSIHPSNVHLQHGHRNLQSTIMSHLHHIAHELYANDIHIRRGLALAEDHNVG